MKFLCEQCKAKYQIADEKVAGKTVRMKCRKCGHLIEVRAAVTETSVSSGPPKDGADRPPATALAASASSPGARPGSGVVAPQRLATSFASARATVPRAQTTAVQSAVRPAGGSSRPSAQARSENPGALAGAFQRNVESEGESPTGRDSLGLSDEWYVAINGVPVGPIRIAEVRRKAAGLAVTEDSLVWQEGLDEWRPVRAFSELAAIVAEAAASARSSLIPAEPHISSMPAPAPVAPRNVGAPRPESPTARAAGSATASSAVPRVTAVGAPRPLSSTPLRSVEASPKAPDARAAAPAAGASTAASSGPMPTGAAALPSPTTRSNVVPFGSRLATAGRLEEDPFAAPIATIPEPPRTLPLVASVPDAPATTPMLAPLAASDPFALPPQAAVEASWGAPQGGMVASAVAPAPIVITEPARRAPPWIAIAMIVLAAAFGITAAIAIFVRPPPPGTVVMQAPSIPTGAGAPRGTATQPTGADPSAQLPPDNNPGDPTHGTGAVALGGPGQRPAVASSTPSSASAASASGMDLSGLGGSQTTLNPDGTGPGAAKPAGQCYSDGQLMGAVNTHQAGIRRVCWERTPSTRSVANISVNISIGPAGNVESAGAGGDDSIVAGCVQQQVRTWTFPAMGCSQKASFGYKFIR